MLPRGFGKVGDASAKTVTLLIENENDLPKLTPKQRSVVDLLFDVNTASVSEICELCSVGTSVLKNLEKYGVISIFDKEIYRNKSLIISTLLLMLLLAGDITDRYSNGAVNNIMMNMYSDISLYMKLVIISIAVLMLYAIFKDKKLI